MSGLSKILVATVLLAAATPALAAKKPLGPGERIDLNRAGVTELMRLPGVGEKRAQAIVAARGKRGFRRPEDVLVVKGIGPRWLAKVRSNVTVGPAASSTPTSQPGARAKR
ncbi:ComEA family DNA-binding protein [Anaeromyxobacter oryzisoli]|uniref:ComEA family DNA-binding protein n=1 Tax=Anaeromyxobacter oryzisoli TaxID=2925408 RepID=UPI001F5801B6|nr:helix-hairpin-helix domain-containing protein [Anaeromyxobacter sp. SG63]